MYQVVYFTTEKNMMMLTGVSKRKTKVENFALKIVLFTLLRVFDDTSFKIFFTIFGILITNTPKTLVNIFHKIIQLRKSSL